MLVVNVPIAFPESRPPLLRLRCEWCIAATIVRFIIVVALYETETPPLLPREGKGAVNAASLKLTPPTSDSPLLPLLLLPLLLRAATKEEERADDATTTAREEKAIQFNSCLLTTQQREKKTCLRAFVRAIKRSLSLSLFGCNVCASRRSHLFILSSHYYSVLLVVVRKAERETHSRLLCLWGARFRGKIKNLSPRVVEAV